MFISELVEGFLLNCRVRNLSERTVGIYQGALSITVLSEPLLIRR
jgi:hypothetical protein